MTHDAPAPVDSIRDVEQLEEMLSEPTETAVAALGRLQGDLLLLGVGGKMGPTLARMAKRASDAAGVRRRVIGVSRFSSEPVERRLSEHGVETIRCDLLDPAQLERLPDAPNVVFMAGMKFGATGRESLTWAMNTHLPALVCGRFRHSRIVAFSTGNVYGMVPVSSGGSVESDAPRPEGEYAMSCLGRERIFEHFSRSLGIPMAVIRLNYAVEMRYGVMLDLAQRVFTGEPVDLTMGCFNAIWQADANAAALAALGHVASPPLVLNVTGPERLRVRDECEAMGRLMGREARFTGEEAPDALLSDARLAHRLVGVPRVSADRLRRWVVDWVERGAPTLGKPTHFEVRDGRF